MGGGNAQKSAMARQKALEKASGEGVGGGGAKGKLERTGDTAAKIAASQIDKAQREQKRTEAAEKKARPFLCTASSARPIPLLSTLRLSGQGS